MKRGNIQCKDIPDKPILEFLAALKGEWANWCFDNEKNVGLAMPPNVPDKVKLAKMRQMIRRGVVDGCICGCRGDFLITEKGENEIDIVTIHGLRTEITDEERRQWFKNTRTDPSVKPIIIMSRLHTRDLPDDLKPYTAQDWARDYLSKPRP